MEVNKLFNCSTEDFFPRFIAASHNSEGRCGLMKLHFQTTEQKPEFGMISMNVILGNITINPVGKVQFRYFEENGGTRCIADATVYTPLYKNTVNKMLENIFNKIG